MYERRIKKEESFLFTWETEAEFNSYLSLKYTELS